MVVVAVKVWAYALQTKISIAVTAKGAKVENKNCEMPNYKAMYEEECAIARCFADKCEQLRQELKALRAVKATAEAFLGRKIEISEEPNEIGF